MKLTTKDLRVTKYGTACGCVGNKALAHPLVIEFIDVFFGGELDEVQNEGLEIEDGCFEIREFNADFSKTEITDEEFYHFTGHDVKDEIESSFDDPRDLILYIFEQLVSENGGTFRTEHGGNHIYFESE